MFQILGDDIYFHGVKIAVFSKSLIPSFRDQAENALHNHFYSEDDIEQIRSEANERTT
jgi:hypothetical protein